MATPPRPISLCLGHVTKVQTRRLRTVYIPARTPGVLVVPARDVDAY